LSRVFVLLAYYCIMILYLVGDHSAARNIAVNRRKVLCKLGIVLHGNHLVVDLEIRVLGKFSRDKEL
jgi:hypothetical protein